MFLQGGGGGGTTGGGTTGGGSGGGGGAGGGGSSTFGACGMRGECTTGVCNRPTNQCVTCRAPIDCDDGFVCTNGACVAATACTSDLDCTPQGKVCDTAGRRCVQCTGSAECAMGQACVGFACTAVASCASSLDCTARKQVCAPVTPPSYPATATQACQDCATSNDCPAGNACQSGVCVDVCGARVCGSVDGVDCGTCPGQGPVQAICLDSGRACMEMIAYATSGRGFGDDPIFALGQLLWTERVSLGSVYALDVATGDTVVIATGQDNPEGVASTATNYYWGAGNSVYQRARSGGAATITASFPGQEERCISLTIAPGQIYCGVYSFTENGDGVYRAPLGGGGTMTSVVSDGYPSVISRGQNVYFLGDARLGFHDAVAGTSTVLLNHSNTIANFFADDTSVFFWRNDALRRIDVASRAETVVYPSGRGATSLVAGISDGTNAWIVLATSRGLNLSRVNLATGLITVLADKLPAVGAPLALALEPTALLLGSPGVIQRISPR
jgi:hypothetical protein